MVNVPALKGIHYAVESGRLAAEAAVETLRPGRTPWTPGALGAYDDAVRQSFIWSDLKEVRNMRQAFGRGFYLGGMLAGAMTATKGNFPPGNLETERDADQTIFRTDRAKSYPAPDGKLTFDKLSSVYLSGNRTRDDAPSHLRVQTRVPEELAVLWERMCPAQVYEAADGRRRGDAVELRPVRRDHRQGRAADPTRGRRRPRVHPHLGTVPTEVQSLRHVESGHAGSFSGRCASASSACSGSGQATSTLGDGLVPVALAFAVIGTLDGSATALGVVLAAHTLPLVLFVLVGGVWADRLPRQLVMLASDLIRVRGSGDARRAAAQRRRGAVAPRRSDCDLRNGGGVLPAGRDRARARDDQPATPPAGKRAPRPLAEHRLRPWARDRRRHRRDDESRRSSSSSTP